MLVEIALGILLLLLLRYVFDRKPEGLPPGRWGLPLIGYIPLTRKSLDEQLDDLKNKHGKVFTWRIGTKIQVFLHDYHAVKEAFGRPEFVKRPHMAMFTDDRSAALGIVGSNGNVWHTNRRFGLRQLREQGMGKTRLVGAIHDQAAKLVDALKAQNGQAANIPYALNVCIVNIIWQMVAGKQFDAEDPQLKTFETLIKDIDTDFALYFIPDFLPWLYKILPAFIVHRIFHLNLLVEARKEFHKFFYEIIDEHRQNLVHDDPKDLLDGYLIDMDEQDTNGHRSTEDLTALIFDIFFAGSDTTTSTFKWFIYYMAAHPKVQRKMQEEIDSVLPKGVPATLEDKPKLPYTEACINEVLRMSSLASVGLMHEASEDSHISGFKIPKGTVIHAAIASIHTDPQYWENPEAFLPERWLNEEGKMVSKKEGFLPFSIGKRVCIGEALARMQLLVFTTAVFQCMDVSPPPGRTVTLEPAPYQPLGHEPPDQDVVFTIRA